MPMVITMPKVLQDKLGPDGADALAQTFNKLEESHRENTLEITEGKFERRLMEETKNLEVKIEQVRTDLEIKIENVRADLKVVRADLETKIAQVQSNLIKWMFLFWAGQITVLTGIMFAFFRK